MEIKYFKLISTLAQVGSLTKSSEKLFLTQSALSHQLREMESILNTKVFVRRNKTFVLTHAGKILLNSSSVILDEIERATNEINRSKTGEKGTIRLATECNTCYHWLPKILKCYQIEFPKVELRIHSNGTKSPIELLLSGKLDVAIVYRKTPHKMLEYIELFTDDVVALVPATHHLATAKYMSARDFINETYITHSRHIEQSIFYEKFLKPKGVVPKNVLSIQLTETVLEMVKEGLGITVMTKWLVKPYINSSRIKMIKLSPTGLKRKWFIGTSKQIMRSKYLERFIEQLTLGIDAPNHFNT